MAVPNVLRPEPVSGKSRINRRVSLQTRSRIWTEPTESEEKRVTVSSAPSHSTGTAISTLSSAAVSEPRAPPDQRFRPDRPPRMTVVIAKAAMPDRDIDMASESVMTMTAKANQNGPAPRRRREPQESARASPDCGPACRCCHNAQSQPDRQRYRHEHPARRSDCGSRRGRTARRASTRAPRTRRSSCPCRCDRRAAPSG